MTDMVKNKVRRWLDEAATAMSGGSDARRDAVMELETTIYERLDERGDGGEVTEVEVREVLRAMGDPHEIGSSMLPVRPLIAAHQTRSFLLNVGIVFAVHFLVVIGATVAGQELNVPPLRVEPIGSPGNLFELLARALRTLLFDVGLVLCGYVLFRRVGNFIRFPRTELTVRPDARRCVEGALFLALVLVVINFFRDNLLALYLPTEDGTLQVPIVGAGIVSNLVLFNIWLGSAIARDFFYARLGERKLTLGLDVVAGVAGLFCLLRIVATRRLIDLAGAGDALENADAIGAVLNTAFVVIAFVTAAMLAARVVKRCFRLALLKSW